MSEKKIVVPEGMLNAVCRANGEYGDRDTNLPLVEAALLWLSENPIVPNAGQCGELMEWFHTKGELLNIFGITVEWQRRMFLAPEPEIPQEIADLCNENGPNSPRWKAAIIESYRRGQQSKGNA